jgi:hypothetical protein
LAPWLIHLQGALALSASYALTYLRIGLLSLLAMLMVLAFMGVLHRL